jgi:hypothetical protein
MKRFFVAALFVASLTGIAGAEQLSWSDLSTMTALSVIDRAPEVPAMLVGRAYPPAGPRTVTPSSPFFVNFIASSPEQSGLPCFTCVNGTQQGTLGVGIPYNAVAAGGAQSYVISWTSLNYSGSCKVALSITSGKTVIDSFSHTFTGIGDGAYDAFYNRVATSYVGAAKIIGKVTCGKTTSLASAPLIFQ